MSISLWGWLDSIPFWVNLPYPIRGALLRAFKTALSNIVGILLAAATDGTLFPAGSSLYTIVATTIILVALDKYLRENALQKAALEHRTDNSSD